MRIEYQDMDNFKIYLYDKKKLKSIEEIKEDPEKFFKDLFLILKKSYGFKLEGLYKLNLFPCNNYGIIIEIIKEIDEFYDKYIDGVDLKIKINDPCEVLYQIDDLLLVEDNPDVVVFKKRDRFYLLYTQEMSDKELYKILEHSNVVYGDKVLEIISPYNLFTNK